MMIERRSEFELCFLDHSELEKALPAVIPALGRQISAFKMGVPAGQRGFIDNQPSRLPGSDRKCIYIKITT